MTDLATVLARMDDAVEFARAASDDPDHIGWTGVALATPEGRALAALVDAAVEWHEHKASIPSPAFLLDHAVTAMLGEPCSCGERCELVTAALGDDDE